MTVRARAFQTGIIPPELEWNSACSYAKVRA